MTKKIFLLSIIFLFLPLASKAITIAPAILETSLKPGQSKTLEMAIFNESDEDLYIDGSIQTFQSKGNDGSVEIVPIDVSNQAVSWFKLPLNSFVLKSGEEVKAPLIINVPTDASVGGYYFSVLWESNSGPRSDASRVNISSQIGNLVFLSVDGELDESLSIDSFSIVDSGNNIFLPVKISTVLNNSGNVHLLPAGQIVVKNIFGRVVDSFQFNRHNGRVMPDSFRRFENTWPEGLQSGFWGDVIGEFKKQIFFRYSVQLQLEYGKDKIRLDSPEIYFWSFPWRILSAVLLIIILSFCFKFLIRKKRS